MTGLRHMDDSANYRGLPGYKARVQSFNMTCNLLREYARVMLEIDVTALRSPQEIVQARLETIRKTFDAIAGMA